jgi:NAD(P)-dependent dehydrogenase (short-subunit alcohol dehydrogenase family)
VARTIVVTGSASGLGAATRRRLEAGGARVIGVDLRDAEVDADVSTAEGRAAAVAAVLEASDGRVDGLVPFAGLGPAHPSGARVVSVNFFGALATLDGLLDALSRGEEPAALAVSSNSATLVPPDAELVDACLAGDEDRARARAGEVGPALAYASGKLALARAVRRRVQPWAAAGVRLNAIAPGPVLTPLLQDVLDDDVLGPFTRDYPIPVGRMGRPDEIAAAACWLLGPEASWVHGAVLFVDGGTDALVRPAAP